MVVYLGVAVTLSREKGFAYKGIEPDLYYLTCNQRRKAKEIFLKIRPSEMSVCLLLLQHYFISMLDEYISKLHFQVSVSLCVCICVCLGKSVVLIP